MDDPGANPAVAPESVAPEPVSDDMLVEHLSLANTQLRQVLEAARVSPAPSLQQLQDLQHHIQQQQQSTAQRGLLEDELVTLLAEENYQLRQLVQQLQLQQQLQQLQQQQEAALLAAPGGPLELNRFTDTVLSPVAVAGSSGVSRAGSSAAAVSAEAGPAAAAAVSPLHGPVPLTPRSPAVMAAGILVPPSASAVQLAEAEAAAQLMTQAVIQAEAAAVYDSGGWQEDHAASSAQQHAHQDADAVTDEDLQQDNTQEADIPINRSHVDSEAVPLTGAALAASGSQQRLTTSRLTAGSPAAAAGNSCSSFGLLLLPKLLLPSRVLRKTFSKDTGSDAGSEVSYASNATGRTNVTNLTTSRTGFTAAGAAVSRTSASSMGLKQIANDLLLMPSVKGSGGAAAAGAKSGAAAAAAAADMSSTHLTRPKMGLAHADAAATVAAAAAAHLWYPAALAVLKDTSSGAAAADASAAASCVRFSRTEGRPVSPGSRAAALAAEAIQGVKYPGLSAAAGFAAVGSAVPELQQQQQQQRGSVAPSNSQLTHWGVSSSSALPPLQPGLLAAGGYSADHLQYPAAVSGAAAAAAQAAAAAAAFAGQVQQEHQQQALPALPKLRLHAKVPATAFGNSTAADSAAVDTAADKSAAAAAAVGSSSSSSPCSDSGFFREAPPVDRGDSSANLEYSVFATDGLQRRYRGSGVFGSNGRVSSDFFGARISMDGSVGLPPRVSLTGGNSSRDRLSDLGGWYGVSDTFEDAGDGTITRTDTLTSNLNSSEWLGVSYQHSEDVMQRAVAVLDSVEAVNTTAAAAAGAADVNSSSDQQWPALPKLQLPGRRQQQQQQQQHSVSSSASRDKRQQQGSDLTNPSSSLVAAPDIPDNFFFQDYVSSCASDSVSSLQGVQSTALQGMGAMCPGTAVEVDSSTTRPASLVTVAGVVSFSQHLSGAASSSSTQQLQSHLALPDLSLLDLDVETYTQQPTPVIGQEPLLPAHYQDLVITTRRHSNTGGSNTAHQQQQQTGLPQAALDPAPGELEGGISSDQLRQLLADLAVAQEQQQQQIMSAATSRTDDAASAGTPSTARSCGLLAMHRSGPLSPPAAVDRMGLPCVTAAGAAALQQQQSGGVPPKSPSRDKKRWQEHHHNEHQQQHQHQHQQQQDEHGTGAAGGGPSLQRAMSAGSMVTHLPPRWGARGASSGSLSSMHSQQLMQQQQQECSSSRSASGHLQEQQQQGEGVQQQQQQSENLPAGAARAAAADNACSRSPAAAAAAVPVRHGPVAGIHSRLRVITAVKGPQSASNSDADTTSTTTTPVHPHGTHTRNNSSSSLPFRAGSGLASITVPPSPASSGVRYVPASPRVVGFDCPSTPQSALRSPSCRSDYSIADSTLGVGNSGVGLTGISHPSHLSFSGAGGLSNSGCSTPRRQPTSPGLLHQALARQTHIGGGSGCSTPSAARRAASTSAVPSPAYCGFAAGPGNLLHPGVVSPAPAGAITSAFAAHAGNNSSSDGQNGARANNNSLLTVAGPLGVPSPTAAAGVGGVNGRARSCSSTLLNMLTGGQLQQQMLVLQQVGYHHPYAQQPQPLPLQQQQQQHGNEEHHPQMLRGHSSSRTGSPASQASAPSTAYGSAVEDAVDGELTAASGVQQYTNINKQHQQQQGLVCSSPRGHNAPAAADLPPPALAVAMGLEKPGRPVSPAPRPASPLARSVSPVLQCSSSTSSSQSLVARAVSPAKGTQEGHPVKLSRFGLMAAAEAHAAPAKQATTAAAAAAVKPAVLRSLSTAVSTAAPDQGTKDRIEAPGAAAAVVAADVQADLSNATSVASPDTPALADAAPPSAAVDSSRDATPTASAAAAQAMPATADSFQLPAGPEGHDLAPTAEAATAVDALAGHPAQEEVIAAAAAPAVTALVEMAAEGAALVELTNVVAGYDPEQTSQQQQQQQGAVCDVPQVHRASASAPENSSRSSGVGVDAGASALISKLCTAKHHEVLVASGRRTSEAVPYVPAYMSSNAANALRQISASSRNNSRHSAVDPTAAMPSTCSSSSSQHIPSALGSVRSIGSSNVAGVAAASECPPASGDVGSCWDAKLVIEQLPQMLVTSTRRNTTDGRDGHQHQQQQQSGAHSATVCVTPGFVKSRVRSWSQSYGESQAIHAPVLAASLGARAACTASAAGAAAAEIGSSVDSCGSKKMRGSTAAAVVAPKLPSTVALGSSRRRHHAKSRAAAVPPATADLCLGSSPFVVADQAVATAALPPAAAAGGIMVFGASSGTPVAAVAPAAAATVQSVGICEEAAEPSDVHPAVQACVTGAVHAVLQIALQPQADDSDAFDKGRARQQHPLKQRQLLRQQQQQRRRQEIAEWAEQQRLQQVGAQQLEGSSLGGQQLDALQHAVCDQLPQLVVTDCAEGPSGYIAEAAASGVGLHDIPRAVVAPFRPSAERSDCGRLSNDTSPAYVDGLFGEPLASIGLVQTASYCPSVDSDGNFSWAAWSSSSSINRCPKLDWWGRSDQGTAGSGGYFSDKGRRRSLQLQQQQHQRSRLSGDGASCAAAASAAAGEGRGAGAGWFKRLRKDRAGSKLQQQSEQ